MTFSPSRRAPLARRLISSVSLTILAALPVAAAAETAVDADQAVQASEITVLGRKSTGYRTDQITTATRTGTDIREIPQSIQVVPREVIDDQQLVDLTGVIRNVSGLQPATAAGNRSESFTIRGFRSSFYAIDSVMLSPAVETNDTYRDLANIERVEVLKGPASVLYGRGDPGGLINIVTKQPQFSPAAGFTVQAGSDQFYRGQADLTGPIGGSGSLAGRLAVAAQRTDTFRDVFEPSTRQFVAPSLLWTPGARTRVSVNAAYTHQETQSDRGIVAVPVAGTSRYVIDLPSDRFLGEAFAKLESQKQEYNYRVEHEATDWLTIRQVGHYDEGKIDLFGINQRGVTVNATTGVRTSARQATEQHETNHNYDFQLDAVAKFQTGGIGHTLVLGGEYANAYRHLLFYRAALAGINIDNPVYGAKPGTFSLQNDRTVKADIWAIYLQDQIDLGERLKLLAGVRFDRAKQSNAAVGAVASADDKKFSPRVGLVFEATPDVSLFADYTRSFQPNLGITVSGAPIAAETGVQYEAGVKADLLDKRLSLTAAAFQLTRAHVAAADPNASSFQLDVGDQRARGVELDVSGAVRPDLKIIASAAYLKTEVTRSADIASFTPGNILANAPKWSGSLWATYEPKAGPLEGFGFGGGVFSAGNRQGDLANSFTIGGYTRVDATVWRDLGDHLRLSISGKNLFDRRYIDSAVSTNEIYPASGRTVLVGLTGKF